MPLLQNPIDWSRHAGARPREEEKRYAEIRTRVAIVTDCFDQNEDASMIGRGSFLPADLLVLAKKLG